MNILVIGNGFDIAHGLPTKYSEFLEFVEVIRQMIDIRNNEDLNNIDWKNISQQVIKEIKHNMGMLSSNLLCQKETWKELLNNNIWIDYFLQCEMYQKENWIDFESEISRVIQSIDNDMQQEGADLNTIVRKITEPFLAESFLENIELREQEREKKIGKEISRLEKEEGSLWDIEKKLKFRKNYKKKNPINPLKEKITYNQLIVRLKEDLNKLIRALEIYLADYVEKIDCKVLSPDIKEVTVQTEPYMHSSPLCKVLNFNYTNICEKIYAEGRTFDFDYVHGKADIDNVVETNNMVLGIDEYLSNDRKNKDIEFIAFKKYYQRIYKENDSKYKEWLEEMKKENCKYEDKIHEHEIELEHFAGSTAKRIELKKDLDIEKQNPPKHELYIFGHSLDVTDRDILRNLILSEKVYTTIFYHSKEELGRKIANLVKVIGQEELIKRTDGSTKTIEFKKQQEMIELY